MNDSINELSNKHYIEENNYDIMVRFETPINKTNY